MRLKRGDERALAEIIDRWRLPLMHFIGRHVRCDQDAAELTHETFIRVYQNCARYQPKAKFSTWLFTIANNLCRNYTRWQSRHPSAELDERVADAARSPSESFEDAELAAAVQRALAALPDELRSALLLFELDDLSYEQIAKSVGCSVRTVETRLHRARETMRRELSAWRKP